jgi:A/G-specific adenine glycosylase
MPRKAKAQPPTANPAETSGRRFAGLEARLLHDSAARGAFRRALKNWYQRDGRDLPWRRTHDPYAVLVSEFMLQQTQVATVIPYYERWLARFPDFTALASAEEAEVLHAWQGLGYYARARNLHNAAKRVVELHGGSLPDDPKSIAALPGVGRYTVGAVASFAFDRPVAAVDANIGRVLARLANSRMPVDSPSGAAVIWEIAEALLPRAEGRVHTSALMELGALLCTPRAPQCLACPVVGFCTARDPESLPAKKPRRKLVELIENCAWIVARGRVLLELQTGSRWCGLCKLPRLESAPPGAPVFQSEYPFTHHRVTLRVFEQRAAQNISAGQVWIDLERLNETAMASPHRRAVEALILETEMKGPRNTRKARKERD